MSGAPPATKRLIVLDTETTGMSPAEGHRVIEIGCLELNNLRKGEGRRWYLDPEREIPEDATRVHGITNEMVAGCPKFADVAEEWLAFIAGDPLVIHNAAFDVGFLNAELARCRLPLLNNQRVIDTLTMARRKFPGASVSLDSLCKRLGVDNSQRTFHGALLDAHLLAEVYVELMGGSQFRLDLGAAHAQAAPGETRPAPVITRSAEVRPARPWPMPAAAETAHAAYLQLLRKEAGEAVWEKV